MNARQKELEWRISERFGYPFEERPRLGDPDMSDVRITITVSISVTNDKDIPDSVIVPFVRDELFHALKIKIEEARRDNITGRQKPKGSTNEISTT